MSRPARALSGPAPQAVRSCTPKRARGRPARRAGRADNSQRPSSVRHDISGEPQCPRPPPFRPQRRRRCPSARRGGIATISIGPHIVRRDVRHMVRPQHTTILAGNIDSAAEILRRDDIGSRDDPFRKHPDQARPHPARRAASSSVSSQTSDQRSRAYLHPTPQTNQTAPQASRPRGGLPSSFLFSGPEASGPKHQITNPKQKNQTPSAAGMPGALWRGREKTRTTRQSGDHLHYIRQNRAGLPSSIKGASRCS